MGKQNKEIIDNMEFLMKELHKEWDRSGANKASVFISLDEVEEVNKTLLLRIAKQQKEAETGDITFKKSVKLSRECYILLRLARKIKAEEHKSYNNGTCYEFEVALDKDELKLFKEMFNGKVK
ncbi:MAG: hypothetical protein ACLTSW_11595 [Coprococcus sp.]